MSRTSGLERQVINGCCKNAPLMVLGRHLDPEHHYLDTQPPDAAWGALSFCAIHRTGDGNLHELNWTGVVPVNYSGNLTAAISAPSAVGDPTAFADAVGYNIVVYRSANGDILCLYWSEGPSGLDELCGFGGTPQTAGGPFGNYTDYNDTHQVVYRASDGHLYELYWAGNDPKFAT
jgi:hypothetical protein